MSEICKYQHSMWCFSNYKHIKLQLDAKPHLDTEQLRVEKTVRSLFYM